MNIEIVATALLQFSTKVEEISRQLLFIKIV